jgi:hypothetical protein
VARLEQRSCSKIGPLLLDGAFLYSSPNKIGYRIERTPGQGITAEIEDVVALIPQQQGVAPGLADPPKLRSGVSGGNRGQGQAGLGVWEDVSVGGNTADRYFLDHVIVLLYNNCVARENGLIITYTNGKKHELFMVLFVFFRLRFVWLTPLVAVLWRYSITLQQLRCPREGLIIAHTNRKKHELFMILFVFFRLRFVWLTPLVAVLWRYSITPQQLRCPRESLL